MKNIKDLYALKNKVTVITGGAGLLGLQHAEILAEAGSNIVVGDLNFKKAIQVAECIVEKYGVKAFGFELDVSNKFSVNMLIEIVLKRFGNIDILINNAVVESQMSSVPFEDYPLEEWEKSLRVNLTGVFLCSQLIGKQMIMQCDGGVIINIASIYGLVGPDQSIYDNGKYKPASYSACKGAVIAFTRYLAAYWANKKIRVNCLTLGGVLNNQSEDFVKKYSQKTQLGRMANKSEYRGAILFLASDASSYMTGSNLIIDGGWTAW